MNSAQSSILVIDDEEAICYAFRRYFERRNYRVLTAGNGSDGLRQAGEENVHIVFLDVRLPDRDGLQILKELADDYPELPVVVITAYGSVSTATEALRNKAFDYISKPLDLEEAEQIVLQVTGSHSEAPIVNETTGLEPAAESDSGEQLLGVSEPMQAVFKRIGRAATTDAAALVTGATGTGKELVARAIHEHSARSAGPFAAVNCGALPEPLVESELFGYARGAFTGAVADKTGKLETAHGGTLFLDELAELPISVQVKLLRFLDTQVVERLGSVNSIPLDVRIIAATNRNLSRAVQENSFRADLYYRLAVIQINVPPLNQRHDDILPLAQAFANEFSGQEKTPAISEQARALLLNYSWPGNVRELRNVIRHAVVMAGSGNILPLHLPETVREQASTTDAGSDKKSDDTAALDDYVENLLRADSDEQDGHLYTHAIRPLEQRLIRRTLEETGGNRSAAAAKLGLHRNTLRQKMRDLGLEDVSDTST